MKCSARVWKIAISEPGAVGIGLLTFCNHWSLCRALQFGRELRALSLLSICAGPTASVAGMCRAGQHRWSLAIELFSAFLQNTTILPKIFPEPEVRVTASLLNRLIFKIERWGGSFKDFNFKTWSLNSGCTAVSWFWQRACACSPSFKP